MVQRRKQNIYQIIGCVIFLVLPLALSPRPPEESGDFFSRPTMRDLIANSLLLMFFYFNYYFLIPKIYFKEKFLEYAFCLLIGVLLITTLPSIATGHYFWEKQYQQIPTFASPDIPPPGPGGFMPPKPSDPTFLEEIGHHVYLFAIVVLFSILQQVNRRLLNTEKERLLAELAHLKAQIHPHFLFNTLNSIYALTVRKDDKAPDSIVKLSEFMRYLLRDANENEVSLDKEIGYITNYVDLQVSRLRDSVKLNYRLSGQSEGKKIAPLLLFSFIENAFKHGVNPDEDSEIDIHIDVIDQSVHLRVVNKKVKIRHKEYSTNIGLANTQERLNLYYPNKHTLKIDNNTLFFNIDLSIDLA